MACSVEDGEGLNVVDGRDGALVDCSVEADLGWEGEEGSCDGGVNPLQEEVEREHVRDA